ncbi:GNAT family N-acetyltransferase [Maribacter sp. HTCC2170]|uniref:GNAT family N-acetyltransferase n=1 Tax=Maribacter sp. (strain HTCC2170 / KCCM 42371) TaxID=313603 RepID=UPI00006BD31F|nr:GNAT family N-acetyltransferase [Maribacter sp. HTCC2170]EAR02722.1 Ribosomal-protein-alanine acetyltransferase [Maribacter sp. HTCC2170]
MLLIKTDRIIVQRAVLSDAPFIFELLNSPTWLEFIGDRGISNLKKAERYIQESLIDSLDKNGYGLLKVCLKLNETPIGLCGFLKRDYLESVDIGYAILPAFEGKGYAHEAAQAVIDYGQKELGLSPILAITSQKNKKSQNLLSKIGLNKKGLIKIDGDIKEALLYST